MGCLRWYVDMKRVSLFWSLFYSCCARTGCCCARTGCWKDTPFQREFEKQNAWAHLTDESHEFEMFSAGKGIESGNVFHESDHYTTQSFQLHVERKRRAGTCFLSLRCTAVMGICVAQ